MDTLEKKEARHNSSYVALYYHSEKELIDQDGLNINNIMIK